MDSQSQRTEISSLGEFGLIEHIQNKVSKIHQSSTVRGIGDDAAILAHIEDHTVISTDMLMEQIHFDLSYCPLKHLGYKSVVVNLSDIYAMNAFPRQITLSMALSNRFSLEAIDAFYEGVLLACRNYQVDLVGGDTTSSLKGLAISVTAIGQAPKEQIVQRNTAKVGDLICVSGDLGAAYLGLQMLEREKEVFLSDKNMTPNFEGQNYMIGRQLKPEARKDIIALLLKENILPSAMIDVSDGLSSDLIHICKSSGVGAIIEEQKLPIEQDVYHLALKFNLDPTVVALNGGEDYELLFTLPAHYENQLEGLSTDIRIIGTVTSKEEGVKILTKSNRMHALSAQGWVNF